MAHPRTTWKPFDHTDPAAAIAFLRNELNQPIQRNEWHAEFTAAVDLLETVYRELIERRKIV